MVDTLTERKKLAKRLLSRAVFWRRTLFWISIPIGISLSYMLQPSHLRYQLDFASYCISSIIYVIAMIAMLKDGNEGVSSISRSAFTREDIITIGATVAITTLVVMAIFWIIGKMILMNAKTTIALTLSKEEATEVDERVEQGFLYMKKDANTLGGSIRRKLKQFFLGLGIVGGIAVAMFIIMCVIIRLTR